MTYVEYKKIEIDNVKIAYREAGPEDGPTFLLLHGWPDLSLEEPLANNWHEANR